MPIVMILENPKDWSLSIQGVEILSAKDYLLGKDYSKLRNIKVFNLCKSYKYQSVGYYVSLLAEARGHKPIPSVTTIQDIKYKSIIRGISDEMDALIQKSLSQIKSKDFVLSIYFGKNLAKRYDKLSLQLFNLFPVPFLRASFTNNGKWMLNDVEPIAANGIPEDHYPFVAEVAQQYFAKGRYKAPKSTKYRYHLGILYNAEDKTAPSNEKAIEKVIKAAGEYGISCETINKNDYGRIAEFDALFIRETTAVNHYTYRFARKAEGEGLVVIDDPSSILKCTNKVYLAELMDRYHIPAPKTTIIHRNNLEKKVKDLSFPIILKKPDSSFSQGVIKVEDKALFLKEARAMFSSSELIIAQEFIPTDFDWRIGMLDRKPLFACKYYMAKKHWQICKWENNGDKNEGKFETFPVEIVPKSVVQIAVKMANLVGDGLYGVDVKQIHKQCYVMEVNDNPNLDYGVEDSILKFDLYLRLMEVFLKRIEHLKDRR